MKNLKTIAVVALVCSLGVALADDDPYADYVKLTRTDTDTKSSWNDVGGWSDGMAPTNTKNYYVAPGARLYRVHNVTNSFRFWNGGQLVVAGTFTSAVSQGDQYSPYIADLVLLPGASLWATCYGPLYVSPYDSAAWSMVTVKGTAASPSKITQAYNGSYTSSGSTRSHALKAKFQGTADSYLTFTRPLKNGSTTLDHGFYCRAETATFADYPGTFKVFGGNTIFKPESGSVYNWPLTALVADDGVSLYMYYNNTYNSNTKTANLRSFEVTGSTVYFNYSESGATVFPILNVTDGFAIGGGMTLRVANCPVENFIGGMTSDDPYGKALKIAHLTGAAAANVGDLSDVSLLGSSSVPSPVTNVTLVAVDAGDGAKDVYIASPGIVTMTNENVETSGHPAGSTQYSAFAAGHEGDWSNGVTPPADSSLHYWAKKRLCFFQTTELPNATLTLGRSSSWKAGSRVTFKEINIGSGVSFGLWADHINRTLTAERLNVVRLDSSSSANIYAGQRHVLNVNADLCGNFGIGINNMNNQEGQINFTHVNTNFHGRFIISQRKSSADTEIINYQFTTTLNDARNLGGTFTQDANTYSAVTLYDFPAISVTNDVDFCEPTRGMMVRGGAKFDVSTGKTMRLANQVTYAGVIDKAGTGTLDLAGTARFINGEETTAPVAGTNVLNVLAGALKVSSKTAADGLAVTFEEGTRLIVPADTEAGYYNVKWDAPLTIDTTSGKLPVEVEMTGNEGTGDITVPICTFNATAAADIPETAFRVRRASNGFRLKGPVTKRTNGDGSVTYLATLGLVGTQFMIR